MSEMSNKKIGDEVPVTLGGILGKKVKIMGCAPCGVWLKNYPTIHDVPRIRSANGARCVCLEIGRTVRIRRRQSKETPGSDTAPVRLETFRILPREVQVIERKSLRAWLGVILSQPNPAFIQTEQAD